MQPERMQRLLPCRHILDRFLHCFAINSPTFPPCHSSHLGGRIVVKRDPDRRSRERPSASPDGPRMPSLGDGVRKAYCCLLLRVFDQKRAHKVRKIGSLDFGSCYTTKEPWKGFIWRPGLHHIPLVPAAPTFWLMKIMPSKKQQYSDDDPNIPSGNFKPPTHLGPITLEDTKSHLEQLRGVSAIAAKLFTLIGEQMAAISLTAPIQRALINVWPYPTPASPHC